MSDNKLRVKQDGDKVLLFVGGKAIVMPWQAGLKVSKAIHSVSKKAEEYANANRIIHDNAILVRAGFGGGLSSHPKIIEETKKEATHNRDLRRYIRGGVKSKEVFGTPTIAQGKQKVNA